MGVIVLVRARECVVTACDPVAVMVYPYCVVFCARVLTCVRNPTFVIVYVCVGDIQNVCAKYFAKLGGNGVMLTKYRWSSESWRSQSNE